MRIDPAITLALVLVIAPLVAQADCKTIPRAVARFASTFPGWTLVTTDGFNDQELADWKDHEQSKECPGFFRLNWNSSEKDVYAVALFNPSATKQERVDVISNDDHPRLIAHLDDLSVAGPWVIFRAKPGRLCQRHRLGDGLTWLGMAFGSSFSRQVIRFFISRMALPKLST